MYLDAIITTWQKEDKKGIPRSKKSTTVNGVICSRPSCLLSPTLLNP